MNAVLLHYRYAPSVAGVERVMEQHARLIARAGHRVKVLCGAGESRETGVGVVEMPWLLEGRGAAASGGFEERVSQAASALRPWMARADRVFVHNVLTMPFHLPCTAALWRLADELPPGRIVNWVHDLAAASPAYPGAAEREGVLLRRRHPAMKAVAVSARRAEEFLRLTGTAADAVIPNGIDPLETLALTPPVARLAAERRWLEADAVLFHPARLLRRKNVELGLRVLAALKGRGVQARLLVTAAPDEHNPAGNAYGGELRRLRGELGLEEEAVFLSDFFTVTNADLASLYSLSDLLWFPSREEGFGLPLLEAAIHRLPTFCTDLPPMNTFELPNATFFDPGAPPEAIAGALLGFLGENRRFLEARREVVRRFAWDALWPGIERLLISG